MLATLSFFFALQLAQPTRLLMSTSQPSDFPGARMVSDAALLVRPAGSDVRPYLAESAWHGLLGDLDGDGSFDLPAGVDALSFGPRMTGEDRGVHSLWFSTDRDGPGYRDGDILMVNGLGVIQVVYAESELQQALQPSSGGLDIDALSRRDDGLLLVSLKDGLASTTVGAIEDGDLILWDPIAGAVQLHATEQQVQSWVDVATGGSSAIGDLKSVTWTVGGELWFTIQSPTAADATVFGNAGGGRILLGWEENDWGFYGSVEVDGLANFDGQHGLPMQLQLQSEIASPSDTVVLRVRDAKAGERIEVLAGVTSSWTFSGGAGLGVQTLNPTLGPAVVLPRPTDPPLYADAFGRAAMQLVLPAVAAQYAGSDFLIQAAGGLSGLSTPARLRVR